MEQSKNDASSQLQVGGAPSLSTTFPQPQGRIPRRAVSAPTAAVASHSSSVASAVATAGGGAVAPRSAVAIGNNATVKNNVQPTSSAAAAPARKIARQPINAYLKVAIIRNDNDVILCDDLENPGTKKEIVMSQLLDQSKMKEGGSKETLSTGESATKAAAKKPHDPSTKSESDEANKDANKKEIPVPTITTVKRYDTDVPPNYGIPTSYVRHVCPTYEEVDETIEYNLDAEDERWWRNNIQFGPYAKARIIVGGEEQIEPKKNDKPSPKAAAAASDENVVKSKEKSPSKEKLIRNKKGKFVKKSSSKKNLDESIDQDYSMMDIDEAFSSETLPPLSSTPKHNYTMEQVVLLNPQYLHSRHSTRALLQRYNPKLPLKFFEQMMDILEKATGFDIIPTSQQTEELFVQKMPQLEDIFGPLSAKDRRMEEEDDELYLARWLKKDGDQLEVKKVGCSSNDAADQKKPLPILAQPITLPAVIQQVYNYWMAKRSKLRKPLLRRYWPPTAATDTNPHQVFRQPNKEKRRRLRKKRQNDMEAYKKMKKLRMDFEKVKVLCELMLSRENVNSTLVELTNDYFEERLRGYTDATGTTPRQSEVLTKQGIESVVLNVPKYFDDGPIVRVKGSKKRKRSSQHQMGQHQWNVDSRDPSPVPHGGAHSGPVGSMHPPNMANLPPGMKPPPMALVTPQNIVVAGHDGGFPAPNFLQPLATRESQPITAYEDTVPSMPSYINGKLTTQPNKFRHRPRLGRGGRIIIDRVPCLSPSVFHNGHPGSLPPPPPTVITYGTPMNRSGYHNATLGADGPNYSINSSPDKLGPNNIVGTGTDAKTAPKAPPAYNLTDLLPKSLGNTSLLSRRIEEICALGLMEDYAAQTHGIAASASVVSSKSGGNTASSAAIGGAALHEELDEVLVPIEDWMEAPAEMKVYGSEKFVIGPL